MIETQMTAARKGQITEAMEAVAAYEGLDVEIIRERVAGGTIAIPANPAHTVLQPRGVGEGLSVKVNANNRHQPGPRRPGRGKGQARRRPGGRGRRGDGPEHRRRSDGHA